MQAADSHSDRIRRTELRAHTLGLPAVLMQAVTHVAPAVGMVAFIPTITGFSGVTSPFAYLLAFLIVLTLGMSLTQLAKHLPAAGGYYTYLSRTVHPRAGFLTAWVLFLVEPLAPAGALAFGGFLFETTMKAEYGFTFPWWLFLLIGTGLVFAVSYSGIRIAVGLIMLLGGLEIAIVVLLSVFSLVTPGPGGINLSSFDPGNSTSANGLFLGVVFTIFAFAGFESVAPLAEETDDPRRVLPRAIMLSIVLAGAFYLFTGWALLAGWGTDDIHGFTASAENPVFVLARRLWGDGWIIVFLAVMNSIVAIAIAASNAATRMLFAMGRSGSLPRALGKTHPARRTPINAIYLQVALTLAFGLGVGFALGPADFFFTIGLAVTLSLMLVYIAGNVGVVRLYRGERQSDFNVLVHLIFPLLSSLALLIVGYKSLNPLPPSPIRYGAVAVAVWLAAGVAVLIALNRANRERWLQTAGSVFDEGADSFETTG